MSRSRFLYEFYIGTPYKNTGQFNPSMDDKYDPFFVKDYTDKVNDGQGNGYLIKEFDMTFSGNSSAKDGDSSQCSITFSNLDDEIVDYLITNAGNDLVAMLKVGDNVKAPASLFSGTVTVVSDSFKDQDRNTKITFQDSKVNIQNAGTSRSFPKGTPNKDIVTAVAKDLQLPLLGVESIKGSTLTGVSVYGKSYSCLLNMCNNYNHDFSIIDSTIHIVPKMSMFKSEVAYLTSNTGLIHAGRSVEDVKSQAENTENIHSINLEFLVDPYVKPNSTVWVKEGMIDGAYKITTLKVNGGTRTASVCSASAVKVDGIIGE